MSPEEIERAINKIAWGGTFIEVANSDGNKKPLVIKPLSIRERNFVEFTYDRALKEALANGLMSKMELYGLYKKKGIWTPRDDEIIEKSKEEVKKLKQIAAGAKTQKEKRRFEKQMEHLVGRYNEVSSKKADLFATSAETWAAEKRTLALVFCSIYDEQDRKLWDNWNDFMEHADDALVTNILASFKMVDALDVSEMRKIARSSSWRFRWNGAKTVGDLFGIPIIEFSAEQQSLLYWSQVYDSVYESMDRPTDDIIEDDEALDKWFEDQSKKRKQKELERTGGLGRIKLSDRVRGHGEIFVVTNPVINPDAPTAEEVDELNSEFTRKFKQQEYETIKKHGTLKEAELRDRKNKIARKIIGSKDAVLSKSSFGQAKGGKNAGTVLPGGSIS
jgi:hypothetical protein